MKYDLTAWFKMMEELFRPIEKQAEELKIEHRKRRFEELKAKYRKPETSETYMKKDKTFEGVEVLALRETGSPIDEEMFYKLTSRNDYK